MGVNMKFHLGKNRLKWGFTVLLTAIATMLAYYLLFKGKTIANGLHVINDAMMSIMYGIIIAYVMSPILNFVEAKWLKPLYMRHGIDVTKPENEQKKEQMRKFSVAISIVFLLVVLVGFLLIVVPQLINSIQSVFVNFPTYVNNIYNFTDTYFAADPEMNSTVNDIINTYSDKISDMINNILMPNMTEIIQQISKSMISLGKGIFNFLVGIIVSVYILNSKEVFCGQGKKLTYAFFKENIANEIIAEFRFIHHTFIGFITGKILDSIIIGILCFIGTSIIGTPYALLVSVVVGVTNVIPFFGPYIGAIIGAILVVMVDPLATLYFLIFVLILQQFDGNILGPKILGNSTGLSSFWVIFAIMFFGGIFGVVGWIVGVPLFAVLYALVQRLTNHYLRKKNLPEDLDRYIEAAYIENGEIKSLHNKENTKYRTAAPPSSWSRIFKRKIKEMADQVNNPEQATPNEKDDQDKQRKDSEEK